MIKKGIFGIFGTNKHLEEEEEMQQQHALSMQREEALEEEGEDKDSIVTNDIVSFASRKLEYLLTEMGESVTVKFKKRDRFKLFLEVVGTEDMGRIIGKEGLTLMSLQVLLKAFVMKEFSTSIQVIIDAGNYRNRRSKKLKERVMKAAKDVIRDNASVELEKNELC